MIYKVTKESAISNHIVKELRATVLVRTFDGQSGIVKADFYKCRHSADMLVAHGHCGPSNAELAGTVEIELPETF